MVITLKSTILYITTVSYTTRIKIKQEFRSYKTACKSLAGNGVPLQRAAYLAGHKGLKTKHRYVQPSRADLRKDAQIVVIDILYREPTS